MIFRNQILTRDVSFKRYEILKSFQGRRICTDSVNFHVPKNSRHQVHEVHKVNLIFELGPPSYGAEKLAALNVKAVW